MKPLSLPDNQFTGIAPGNTACGSCLELLSVIMPLLNNKTSFEILLRMFQKIFVANGLMPEETVINVTK